MLIDLTTKHCVIVRKEVTDPKFGKDESWFFYKLKQALQKMGKDCIKKLAYKDGHLVDDSMIYIRDRKKRWYIFDPLYSVRIVSEEFDKGDEVVLTLVDDERIFHETRS